MNTLTPAPVLLSPPVATLRSSFGNTDGQPEKVTKKVEGKLKTLGNVAYLRCNDKPDNLNGYPSNQISPYIYRAGGVSHWDRCLSLFTRSSRHFFAPTSSLPLSANFLTSKNNDK
jgi:hypothetical protein